MTKINKSRDRLVLQVWCELGAGRLSEGYITDKTHYIDGYIEGGQITVNPAPAVVETCVHEILHRLHPEWSEPYIANRTTYVLRRMTHVEVQAFYEEFKRRARKRRRPIEAAC